LFDSYFERKQSNALHNGASGGGAVLLPEHARQNGASGGATFAPTRGIGLQHVVNDF
jgi:hypothetical protein